jgi:hypothetical protein
MRKILLVVGISTVFLTLPLSTFAQLDLLFASFDCREHADYFHEQAAPEEIVTIDSSLITLEEITPEETDTVETWRQWNVVENFAFGKDRGTLTMIADLNALHPFFRDRVKELIRRCKAQGVELAIVETYRTHAKQNEYKAMGRKYTNSKGGKSKHQYGLAVDLVPIVKGVAVWDNVLLWRKIGVTGERIGLRWGGRWKKPYDPAHFEWTGGLTSADLAVGSLPRIPADHYPCAHEDVENLRQFWSQWERIQEEVLSQRMKAKNVNSY